MLSLVFVSAALGLSNFAAATAIGLSGVDARKRVRVAIVFGTFEAAMPLLGLAIGHHLATSLGSASANIGGSLLIVTGGYTVWQARRTDREQTSATGKLGPLVVTAIALSVDNLVIGFALGTLNVPVVVAAITIGVVSVGMSLVGLELGDRLGSVAEKWSTEVGGVVLILVGIAIAMRVF